MSICSRCQRREERAAPHKHLTQEYYDALIKALKHVAYRHGYALAVHGSLGFDIDLIACPWRESCTDAASVAEAIRETAEMIVGTAQVRDQDKQQPTKMPCGRLAWAFYLVHEPYPGPYIDLSVMPKGAETKA